VDVVGGVARLAEHGDGRSGVIAGGTARLIDVLRRVVQRASVPLAAAVTAASATPARLIGLDGEVGDLIAGRRADVLVTDRELNPLAVMRAGRWITGAPNEPVH
jgi:N-acetylglucosamine-6-phosphate deacetylase